MSILNAIGTVLQIIVPVLGWLGKKKEAKNVEILATGIEKFARSDWSEGRGKTLKNFVKDLAEKSGIEARLHKKIRKFQDRLWKKIL